MRDQPPLQGAHDAGVNAAGNSPDALTLDVFRVGHIDLLHDVLVLGAVPELLDHLVGVTSNPAKVVEDLFLFYVSEQVLNPQTPEIGLVVSVIVVAGAVVKPGPVLRGIGNVNKDPVLVLPVHLEHLLQAPEDILAGIATSSGFDQAYEVHNLGKLGNLKTFLLFDLTTNFA